jgi:hypothetical protein
MRRLFLILLVSLLVVPAAALAAVRGAGDGTVVVKNAAGKVTVVGKGTIFGHFDDGTLTVVDYNPDDLKDPQVSGAERFWVKSDTTTRYAGTDVRFLFSGGSYKIIVYGTGVDISAVGKGKVTALGDATVANDGTVAVNGTKPVAIQPFTATTLTFGTIVTP